MSFDNILSYEQVSLLRDRLKQSPETAYINIGIRFGVDTFVEIFKLENHANLLNRLTTSIEFNSNEGTTPKVRSAFSQAQAKMDADQVSGETRIGKLCSIYALMWTQKLTPNWFFYGVPLEYQNTNRTSYPLIPPKVEILIQNPQSGRIHKGKGNQQGRGNLQGRGDRGNRGFDRDFGSSDRGLDRITPNRNERQVRQSSEPRKPVFSGIASRINSTEAKVATLVPPPILKVFHIKDYINKSNDLLESIKAKFELSPFLKITCDRQNGNLAIHKIGEDEDFDIHGFNYCPFHSGTILTGLEPISEELRFKTTGPYGFMTRDGKAYDCCYLSGSIEHTSEEINHVNEIRNTISKNLSIVENEVDKFNNNVTEQKEIMRDQFLAKQHLHVANIEYSNDLGDHADRNIQHLQTVMNNPLFQKTVKKEKIGRSLQITDHYIDLPIISHTLLSSFFGNDTVLLNSLDRVSVKMMIMVGDEKIEINIPTIIHSQFLTLIDNIRNKILEEMVNIYVNGDDLICKFNNYPITFKFSPMETRQILKILELNIQEFEPDYYTAILTPEYSKGSYRSAIFNLGKSFAESNEFYEQLKNNYDVISYIGACYISQYSDILADFILNEPLTSNIPREIDNSPENENENDTKELGIKFPYSIIKSPANSYSIPFDEIEITRQSITNGLKEEGNLIKFSIGGEIPIELFRKDVLHVLRELNSLPEIIIKDNNKFFIIDGLLILIDEVSDYFRELESAINSLSDRAKKEITSSTSSTSSTSKVIVTQKKQEKWQLVNSLEDEAKSISNDYNTKFFDTKQSFDGITITAYDAVKIIETRENIDIASLSDYSIVKIDKFQIPAGRINMFFDSLRKFVQLVSDKGDLSDKEIADNTLKRSGYNTKYFTDKFVVHGKTYSGYDAMKIIDSYITLKSINLSYGNIDISFNVIPLTEYNIEYLTQVLFDEETALKIIENYSRSYAISMILFGSLADTFIIKGSIVNLKDTLSHISPYNPPKRSPFAISQSEAKKAKLLSKYMEYMEDIDRIAINSYEVAIEMFGNDMIKSIFTGYQTKINGILTPLDYENKENVVEAAGIIYMKRLELRSFFKDLFRPFLEKIHAQDSVKDDIPSFYNAVGEYIVFSSEDKYVNEPELVVPSNPFIITRDMEYEFNSMYLESFEEYASSRYHNEPIFSKLSSPTLNSLMNLLFPYNNTVTVNLIFTRYLNIIVNSKYMRQLSILDLINRFEDLSSKFAPYLTEKQRASLESKYNFARDLFNHIDSGKISNKEIDNLPSIKQLDDSIQNIIIEITNILGYEEMTFTSRENSYTINPAKAFKEFIHEFQEALIPLNERRKRMRNYIKEFISNIYNVQYKREILVEDHKYISFREVDIITKDGRTFEEDINKIDVIGFGIGKIIDIIDIYNSCPADITYHNSITTSFGGFDNDGKTFFITLDERINIYNKFKSIIVNARTKTEYDMLLKGICYYLFNNLKRRYYEIYMIIKYSAVMKQVGADTLNKFKQIQAQFCTDLYNLQSTKDKKMKSNVKLSNTIILLKEKDDEIMKSKSKLNTDFVENVSLVDIIVNIYDRKKKSYGSDDSDFKIIIDNIKLRLESIKRNFDKVNDLDIKIMMSLYEENMDIYNIRRSISRDLKIVGEKFYALITNVISYIKLYSKLPSNEQFKALNERISKYNLTVESNISTVNNSIRSKSILDQENIRSEFGECRLTWQLFELMRTEEDNIRRRLFIVHPEPIIIPKRDDQVKVEGYGSELNVGIVNQSIDSFTLQETTILGKNISRFLELMSSALRVIDCGPGLHLLSDSIEAFIILVNNIDTIDNQVIFKTFRDSIIKFIDFNKGLGKSINDIILNSEFKTFVSIINGSFDELKGILDLINFYDTLPNVFNVYSGVTNKFVRGILITFDEIVNMDGINDIDVLLKKLSINCEQKFDDENINVLVNTLSDFNSACIDFLDEYEDNDGVQLNDIEVIKFHQSHLMKTRSLFMSNLFKKLNRCVHLYISQQNEDFKKRVIERFVVYVELLFNKFNSLKSLEKYMLNR